MRPLAITPSREPNPATKSTAIVADCPVPSCPRAKISPNVRNPAKKK